MRVLSQNEKMIVVGGVDVARTIVEQFGGTVGGRLGTVICGPVLPPIGPVVCSFAGKEIGKNFATSLFDNFTHPAYPQPVPYDNATTDYMFHQMFDMRF
jgi:hypothetical protein